jgi:hypothetical protein
LVSNQKEKENMQRNPLFKVAPQANTSSFEQNITADSKVTKESLPTSTNSKFGDGLMNISQPKSDLATSPQKSQVSTTPKSYADAVRTEEDILQEHWSSNIEEDDLSVCIIAPSVKRPDIINFLPSLPQALRSVGIDSWKAT